jgi:hypothetical protein
MKLLNAHSWAEIQTASLSRLRRWAARVVDLKLSIVILMSFQTIYSINYD